MKLDPGIHIVMHSVLSLKPGVTTSSWIGVTFHDKSNDGNQSMISYINATVTIL